MARLAPLLAPALFALACHAGAPKLPKPAPRAAADYVPEGVDGLMVVEVARACHGSLGMALSPVLRETGVYRQFTLQSGIDLLSQSDRLAVATSGLGSKSPAILFVLEGSFDPQKMQQMLIGEAAGGAADPETVYLLEQQVGVAFPRPGVVVMGSARLVEHALLVAQNKEEAAVRTSPMKELVSEQSSELWGALLLPQGARERIAQGSSSVFATAWAIRFQADLKEGTAAHGVIELGGEEAARDAARQLASLLPQAGDSDDPLLASILSSMKVSAAGEALRLDFSLDEKAVTSLRDHGRELLGRAMSGGQASKGRSKPSEGPRYEM